VHNANFVSNVRSPLHCSRLYQVRWHVVLRHH